MEINCRTVSRAALTALHDRSIGLLSIVGVCALLLAQHASAGAFNFFAMTKTANPATFTAAGQVITYTYVVNNSFDPAGQPNASISSLTDDKAGAVNINACTSDSGLPPKFWNTITCITTYTITPADMLA